MRKAFSAISMVLFLGICSLGVCAGQTATSNPLEPQAIGKVYFIDPSTQTLKALPDEQFKDEFRGNHAMATKLIAFLRVAGLRSSFRIKAGVKTEFVFKVGNPESVALYAMQQKKNDREADYATIDGRYNREQIRGLAAEVTQFEQSAYKLVPSAPLAPGEYMIYAGDKIFTFGIDQ